MLELEYQRDTSLEITRDVASDSQREAYDSLASSETSNVARGFSRGSVPFAAVAGVAMELRDAVFKLDPVGNVMCKRVIGDYLYGTCAAGSVEYNCMRNVCFKIKEDDPRLFPEGITWYGEPLRCIKVQYQAQMELNDAQIQLLHALTDQRVGTDALNQGIKTIGAQVRGRVYRDVIGGFGSKYQDLHLADLLLLDGGASE